MCKVRCENDTICFTHSREAAFIKHSASSKSTKNEGMKPDGTPATESSAVDLQVAKLWALDAELLERGRA